MQAILMLTLIIMLLILTLLIIIHKGNNMNTKFDILLSQVNGLTNMRENFRLTYEQQISKIIHEQINQGIERFHEMDELDKDSLCVLYTQKRGHDRSYAISMIDDLDGVTGDLLHYISNYSAAAAIELAESMRKGLWQQYEDDINELFDEIKTDRLHEQHRENGLSPHVDSINGEVRWYK